MVDRSAAYRGALAGLQEELAELEERTAKVRTSIAVIADLLGSTSGAAAAPASAREEVTPIAPVASINPGSTGPTIAEAAQIILREEGRHMRALPITERIVELGLIKPSGDLAELRASVGSVLAKNARKRRIFTKPAKGLFGLVEWGDGPAPKESDAEYLTLMFSDEEEDEDEADVPEEQKEAAGG